MTKVTLVSPIYNLHGVRVDNLLQSINCQTQGDIETILVDYGSTEKNHDYLLDTVEPYNVKVIYVKDVIWSPPRACNIGIRQAKGEIVIKIDADLILEHKTIEDTVNTIGKRNLFIIRQPLYLPRDYDYENLNLPRDYGRLRETKTHYQLPSYGGFFAAPRTWWHHVRGYDERYVWYGCNDWDLWNRALHSKMNRIIYGEPNLKGMKGISPYRKHTHVYHQWHRKPWERLELNQKTFDLYRKQNRQIYNASTNVIRNTEDWGKT